MIPEKSLEKQFVEIAKLYPDLDPEQLADAEHNFDVYIQNALLMYERIRHDPDAYRRFLALIDRPIADDDPSVEDSPQLD